jgi:hypothetical protein
VFVRFRQTKTRLQMSRIETRRVDGKVRHQHVASLGSIAMPFEAADRVALWAKLFERISKLSNCLDADAQRQIFDAIHARVPLMTQDDLRTLQRDNARTDVDRWTAMRDLTAGVVADKERLVVHLNEEIAEGKKLVADGDDRVKGAQGRIDAIERGEPVQGGLDKPEDIRAFLKSLGWTDADQRHARLMALIPEERIYELSERSVDAALKGRLRRDRRIIIQMLSEMGFFDQQDETSSGTLPNDGTTN